jgi:hypothetical protein
MNDVLGNVGVNDDAAVRFGGGDGKESGVDPRMEGRVLTLVAIRRTAARSPPGNRH